MYFTLTNDFICSPAEIPGYLDNDGLPLFPFPLPGVAPGSAGAPAIALPQEPPPPAKKGGAAGGSPKPRFRVPLVAVQMRPGTAISGRVPPRP